MSRDLIIVGTSSFRPYQDYRKVDFYLKNRTLQKYRETDVVFLTRSRKLLEEMEKGSLRTELSFLWGDEEGGHLDISILSLLFSSLYLLKKYKLDDINNIAIFNGSFLPLRDLEGFYFNLFNNIKYNDRIIYGGKMPIICLASMLYDYFMKGKEINIKVVRDICSSLNIKLEKIDIDFIYV